MECGGILISTIIITRPSLGYQNTAGISSEEREGLEQRHCFLAGHWTCAESQVWTASGRSPVS